MLQNLSRDPSLRFTDSGRRLLRWLFGQSDGLRGCRTLMDSIPPHCAYTVAALARAHAREWLEFADDLECRLEREFPHQESVRLRPVRS